MAKFMIRRMTKHILISVGFGLLLALAASCSRSEDKTAAAADTKNVSPDMPAPVREALVGPKRSALLLTHAWFYKDSKGASHPGPARLDIWRKGSDGNWGRTRVEDADSNVFHKAMPWRDGILTISAEKAMVKLWNFADGQWHQKTLWQRDWGGRFQRMRDVEIGDVDGDGLDELVLATHDSGVIAVIDPATDSSPIKIREMDQKADTFGHEIEIGDVDGDGKLEFFATISDRNKVNVSQAGGFAMYRWNGDGFDRTWLDHRAGTHAKEILARDLDHDGKAELFEVLEAEVDPNNRNRIVRPVRILQFVPKADGSFDNHVIATIDDRQTRFLVPGDFDGDGTEELVAAAFRKGLFYLTPSDNPGQEWQVSLIDGNSSGFEHAAYAADLDGDGRSELYVAADDQGELSRYDFDKASGKWTKKILAHLDPDVFTWNITTGRF